MFSAYVLFSVRSALLCCLLLHQAHLLFFLYFIITQFLFLYAVFLINKGNLLCFEGIFPHEIDFLFMFNKQLIVFLLLLLQNFQIVFFFLRLAIVLLFFEIIPFNVLWNAGNLVGIFF